MLEFESVPVPAIAPQACVGCGGGQGPMVDMQRELRGWGRVYACASCVERQARALGMVKGKQRNELLAVARDLKDRDVALAGLQESLEAERLEHAAIAEQARNLGELYSVATGRIQQLEARIADDARAALDLVGATG